jgi:hypothetical protein
VLGGARRFAVVMPAAAVYYLTVASADNWAGAVCNLGRYFMPVAPLAVALVGIAIDRVPRRGALALGLMLAAWTGLFAVALWQDPHAANDSALLLAKSAYADGHQYIPDLFIRRWSDGAPGLWARIAVWLAGLGAVAWWLKRVAASSRRGRGPRGALPLLTLAVVAGAGLAAGFLLERWPGTRRGPVFLGAMPIRAAGPGDTPTHTLAAPPVVFVSGAASVREDEAILGPGVVEFLLRAPLPASSLRVTVGGQGSVLRATGLSPLVLRPTGALLDLPLVPYHEVRGRDGLRVAWSRTSLTLEGEAVLRLGEEEVAPPQGGGPPGRAEGEMEPEPGGDR